MIDSRFADRTGEDILGEVRRFWFDTAQAAGAPVLAALNEVADPRRVLFGSDWPYCPESVVEATADAVTAAHGTWPRLASGIDRRHALALFPRLRSADELE